MASLLLTERQKTELNVAILEYLISQGENFNNTANSFKTEANLLEPIEIGKGLLEKKWTSVIRLQKRVMELEAKVTELQQQRSSNGDNSARNGVSHNSSDSKMLPKPPASKCLTGHRAPVTSVACHPVYSLIASGSDDSTIRIWDHETGQYERTLKGHTGAVTGVVFDSNGLLLASCSADMSAKLWDTTTFQCTKTLKGHDHTLSSVKFMPSNDQLLTCSRDQTIKCWEVATGYCVRTFSGAHSDWIKCISISLDGQYLASGGTDQTIVIWTIATGQPLQTLRGHEHVIETLCYGKKPVDAASIIATAASTSGSRVSSSSSSNVKSTDVTGGGNATETQGIVVVDYSYLASGSRDRSVKLWDPLKAVCLMTFAAHENWVRCVLFHPSFKYIISCSDDKSIRVLDIKEGRCMRTIADAHTHFVQTLAMSPNYPVLVSGSVDKNVALWSCS